MYGNTQSWARKGKAGEKYYIFYDYTKQQYSCTVYLGTGATNPKLYEKICIELCQGADFTLSPNGDRKTCIIPK